MRVLPILFNTELVRAILDGRKTVTRRLVKPQPTYSPCDGFTWKGVAYGTDLPPTIKGAAYNFRYNAPYQPGDILWVQETWKIHDVLNEISMKFEYRADGNISELIDFIAERMAKFRKYAKKNGWQSPYFMPKEAARIWLKVKDVRVERLQEITEEEAEKEGCQAGSYEYKGAVWGQEDTDEWTAIEDFVNVWNSTIKKSDFDRYGWDANPWVWVIEFERCDKPEE